MNYEMMGDAASDLKAALIGAGFSEATPAQQAEMDAARYDTGLVQSSPNVPDNKEAIFVENLMKVPAFVKCTVLGSSLTSGPTTKRVYLPPQAVADIRLRNLAAQNELETDWLIASFKDNLWDKWIYLECARVATFVCNKNAYFYNLSHRVRDPSEYLKMLMLYRGAGINLRKTLPWGKNEQGIGRRPLMEIDQEQYGNYDFATAFTWAGAGGDTTSAGDSSAIEKKQGLGEVILPYASGDRLAYERAVKGFYEVIYTEYIKDALDTMAVASQTSENMVRTVFAATVNRFLQNAGIAVSGSLPIEVTVLATKDAMTLAKANMGIASAVLNQNPTTSYTVTNTIPNDPSFIDGPPIVWDKGTFSLRPLIHPLTGETIFDGINVKNGDLLTCQLALQYFKRLAFVPLENQLSKLAARKAELEDPNAVLTAGAAQLDPYRNLSLVYDPEASRTAGSTVFQDVGLSTASRKELPKLVVGAPGTPDAKYFNMRDQLIYDAFRTYSLDEGGDISAEELRQKGVIAKKGSIVPWLIGGLAAGLIAMQAM